MPFLLEPFDAAPFDMPAQLVAGAGAARIVLSGSSIAVYVTLTFLVVWMSGDQVVALLAFAAAAFSSNWFLSYGPK